MSRALTTRIVPSRSKAKMVGGFYLVTLLMGGFFFLAGSKVDFVIDVAAAIFYIAATALFYVVNKDAKKRL